MSSPSSPCGLSPRVRGNFARWSDQARQRGSIPACAGEPRAEGQVNHVSGVYPRVCGGTGVYSTRSFSQHGLSPRVRGNRPGGSGKGNGNRSIPACAGEPPRRQRKRQWKPVYPRVCGGTSARTSPCQELQGLSPRVRGNLANSGCASRWCGSIPACAGEPFLPLAECACQRVYPRVCGGTRPCIPWTRCDTGLSPRVRGNPYAALQSALATGSIPACAGEPTGGLGRTLWYWVYPRVCGGTCCCLEARRCALGLSPRVRGNRHGGTTTASKGGSIPACAGEPAWRNYDSKQGRVYPRVCGGTQSGSLHVHQE